MSEVYIKEPATKGKVILRTTHGDLEIELWSTECPKACRNFCQLILEGHYDGTLFHRVIKDFCIQGGDKTGDGGSCESIYGKPYDDEIHPRLKFRYRGMMGIASAGRGTKTNGSQFFIVLNRAATLDGKHTLFAKVVGQTVYNLVRLSEVEVDKNDAPLDPPRIVRAELVWDPFEDLEPRRRPAPPMRTLELKNEEHRRAPVKKKNVLSFTGGEDDDSDQDAGGAVSATGKSAHDLLNDPKLLKGASSKAVVEDVKRRSTMEADAGSKRSSTGQRGDAKGDRGKQKVPEKKKKKADSDNSSDSDDSNGSKSDADDDVALERSKRRQEEIVNLKKGIHALDKGGDEEPVKQSRSAKTALEEQRLGYSTRQRVKAEGRAGRRAANDDAMNALASFQDRLRKTFAMMDEEEEEGEEKEEKDKEKKKDKKDKKEKKEKKDKKKKDDKEDKKPDAEEGTFAAIWQEGDEEADENWLGGGGLKFHTSGDKAFKMTAMKARDNLEIFDPLAAKGNAEVLAEARKRRTEQLTPGNVKRSQGSSSQGKKDKW